MDIHRWMIFKPAESHHTSILFYAIIKTFRVPNIKTGGRDETSGLCGVSIIIPVYSYDVEFNGRPNGAMSAYAIQVIKQNPNVTYRESFDRLRALLPSNDYSQSPQLEGSDANKDRKLFEPLAVEPGPEPVPSPTPSPTHEPIPSPNSPGCLMGAVQQTTLLFKG